MDNVENRCADAKNRFEKQQIHQKMDKTSPSNEWHIDTCNGNTMQHLENWSTSHNRNQNVDCRRLAYKSEHDEQKTHNAHSIQNVYSPSRHADKWSTDSASCDDDTIDQSGTDQDKQVPLQTRSKKCSYFLQQSISKRKQQEEESEAKFRCSFRKHLFIVRNLWAFLSFLELPSPLKITSIIADILQNNTIPSIARSLRVSSELFVKAVVLIVACILVHIQRKRIDLNDARSKNRSFRLNSTVRSLRTFIPEGSHYAALQLPVTASASEIKAQHRRFAIKYHPDKNANQFALTARFIQVQQAYEILSDTLKRRAYDEKLLGSRLHVRCRTVESTKNADPVSNQLSSNLAMFSRPSSSQPRRDYSFLPNLQTRQVSGEALARLPKKLRTSIVSFIGTLFVILCASVALTVKLMISAVMFSRTHFLAERPRSESVDCSSSSTLKKTSYALASHEKIFPQCESILN